MLWGESEFQTLYTLSPASTLEHVFPTYGLIGFEMDSLWKCVMVGFAKLVVISFSVAGGIQGGFHLPALCVRGSLWPSDPVSLPKPQSKCHMPGICRGNQRCRHQNGNGHHYDSLISLRGTECLVCSSCCLADFPFCYILHGELQSTELQVKEIIRRRGLLLSVTCCFIIPLKPPCLNHFSLSAFHQDTDVKRGRRDRNHQFDPTSAGGGC